MFKINRELTEYITNLIYQPAARRTATLAGTTLGFTIVELLIVIVVIGILASIVIVAFNGINERARGASVQSDIKNFQKAVELYKAQNGLYPSTTQLANAGGVKINKDLYTAGGSNNFYYCVSTGSTRFAVGATSESSRKGYIFDSETGLRSVNSVYGSSTCPNTTSTETYYNTDKAFYNSSGAPAISSCTWTSGACVWGSWIN